MSSRILLAVPACRLALGLALLVTVASLASADLIFLKDGFAIQGRVKRESVTEIDTSSGEAFMMPKGFFLVDDGPRRIYFSPKQVGVVKEKAPPTEEFVLADKLVTVAAPRAVPPIFEVLDAPFFDEQWNRRLRFRTIGSTITVDQHLAVITPYYARVDGTPRYAWAAFHLTRELGPELVHQLLSNHSKFKITKDMPAKEASARRLRYCDFCVQAGWLDEAEAELERMVKDFPDKKETFDNVLAAVGKIKAREKFEDIKRLALSGQFQTARRKVAEFPEAHASEETLANFTELKADQAATVDRLARLTKHLTDLPRSLEGPHAKVLKEAGTTIRKELHPEAVGRLETFLGQAGQAERRREGGQSPALSSSELMALAVTGWLLGNAAAEPKPETAVRLWLERAMVLDYLRTPDSDRRKQLMAAFLKGRGTTTAILDEMVQVVPHLPPPEPEEVPATRQLEMTVETAARRDTKYHLRLPGEYHHHRPWPVLIVLHDGGEKATRMLDRWSEAAEQGYIVAAPEWERTRGGGFNYTEAEHEIVLELVRDLRKRFNIDSDRVFLFGMGQGAYMAFDVGLSHPDLFAGVIPMAAAPRFFPERYWRNGFYLPFLVINGDRSGEDNVKIRELFTEWAMRAYPSLWVQYKGRGAEWFSGEIPNILDWMRTKRRAFPLDQLGTDGNNTKFGNEFTTMRQSDDSFYWITLGSIHEGCTNAVESWRPGVTPARVTARIDTKSNEIYIRHLGVKRLTVWLGRNGKGESMIDFDRPLSIRVNLQARWVNRPVTPSLNTLLEDLYQRGDRQRLFLAKVELGL